MKYPAHCIITEDKIFTGEKLRPVINRLTEKGIGFDFAQLRSLETELDLFGIQSQFPGRTVEVVPTIEGIVYV